MNYKQFFFGIGIWIVLLIAFIVWERAKNPNVHPLAHIAYEANREIKMAANDKPYYTTNAWGQREEHSKMSTEKTLNAVSNFCEKVSHSGLKISVNNPLQTKVFAGKKTIAYAYSDDSIFHVHYSAGEKEAVHDMHKRGTDENGLPRNFNEVVSAAEPNLNDLAEWADPNKYPIQSTMDDVKADVTALLNDLNIGGTDRYILESVRQEQLGIYRLPFDVFTFATKADLGQAYNGNRDAIEIVVRVGGADLAKGQAELVYFTDTGFIQRHLEAQPQNATLRPVQNVKTPLTTP